MPAKKQTKKTTASKKTITAKRDSVRGKQSAAKKSVKTKTAPKKKIVKKKPAAKKNATPKKKVIKRSASVKKEIPDAAQGREKEIIVPVSQASEIKKPDLSSQEELNRLIEADAASENVIFRDEAESTEEGYAPTTEQSNFHGADKPEEIFVEEETVYMSDGEEVSVYRRVLLWTSVSLCAGVIGFGWFLTVGPNIGMGSDGEKYQPTQADLEETAAEMRNDLIELKENIQENLDEYTEGAEVYIEDNTLETIVDNIKNSTTTDEVVAPDGRDIFSPPSSTDEVPAEVTSE